MICKAISQPERLATWGEPIPEAMRLGWTCDVPYCFKREHMALASNHNHGRNNWKELSAKLNALSLGASLECRDLPNDQRAMRNMRTALAQMSNARFVARSWGDKRGVTLTRVGTWDTFDSQGVADVIPMRRIPLKSYRNTDRRMELRPAVIWLGQSFNPTHWREAKRGNRCSWKGCAFPAIAGKRRCRHHYNFFIWNESMCDRTLDTHSIFNPHGPMWQEYVLAAEFLVKTESLEHSLIVEAPRRTGERAPVRDDRHQNLGNSFRLKPCVKCGWVPCQCRSVTAGVQASPTMRHMGHGSGHRKKGGLRSQRAKRKSALRNKIGGKHPAHDKLKRWSREAAELEPLSIDYIPPEEREGDGEVYETLYGALFDNPDTIEAECAAD